MYSKCIDDLTQEWDIFDRISSQNYLYRYVIVKIQSKIYIQ